MDGEQRESLLYAPFKSVGFVTDGNPFCINRLGEENFLSTSVRNAFQVYRMDKLTICMVSGQVDGTIQCLYVHGHDTFVGVGKRVIVFNRVRKVREYALPANAIGMCGVGSIVLVYDNTNYLSVIDTKERRVLYSNPIEVGSAITAVVHPATYINKFLIGFEDGSLVLWNCNKKSIIHQFSCHTSYFQQTECYSSRTPSISALEQSPACDVVCVGFISGAILLINLKLDRVLFAFQQDGGAVQSVSFRTDTQSSAFPYMATSSADGRIFVWNLGTRRESSSFEDDSSNSDVKVAKLERKLQFVMDEAHFRSVRKLQFLHGEPILVSSSEDNSIKVWIFDSPDGTARLLRSRSGHSDTPTRIRYYAGVTNGSAADNADATSCEIVSCGDDHMLRLSNTALESHNMELSQKPILKKHRMLRRNERLPLCTGFDMSEARERNWGNLVTIHRNHCNAYVWRYKHRTVTEMVLRQPHWKPSTLHKEYDNKNAHCSAVAVSACGNYCVVGSKGGVVFVYNIQSGLPNGAFPSEGAIDSLSRASIRKREQSPANVLAVQKAFAKESSGAVANSLKRKQVADEDSNTAVDSTSAGHSQEVTGVFVDLSGTILVSCSIDGDILFWDFLSHKLLSRYHCTNSSNEVVPQLRMVGFRDAGFVAVVGQDRAVRVFDVSLHKLIRRFADGHSREISDVAFSPDGRRLLSCSWDRTIRVYDLPSGRCLNWIALDAPVLSLTISPSGEYLCFSQANKVGIFMLIDKSLYETVHLWSEPKVPVFVANCCVRVDDDEEDIHASSELGIAGESADATAGAFETEQSNASSSMAVDADTSSAQAIASRVAELQQEQRGSHALTLTTQPRAFWHSLFNLEAVKERNRPSAAPTAPKAAPFFLPTVHRLGSNGDGVSSAFPTPAEAARLEQQINNSKSKEQEEEEKALKELAAMSAWQDDDEEQGWGQAPDQDWGPEADANANANANAGDPVPATGNIKRGNDSSSNSSSKQLNKRNSKMLKNVKTVRCTLEIYLTKLKSSTNAEERKQNAVVVLAYLKSLSAPAIDVELRALCSLSALGVEDGGEDDGRALLLLLLEWFGDAMSSAADFELLQAYLCRLLIIYSDTFLRVDSGAEREEQAQLVHQKFQSDFAAALYRLLSVHQAATLSFRQLMQNNLCLLKLLSGLPMM